MAGNPDEMDAIKHPREGDYYLATRRPQLTRKITLESTLHSLAGLVVCIYSSKYVAPATFELIFFCMKLLHYWLDSMPDLYYAY